MVPNSEKLKIRNKIKSSLNLLAVRDWIPADISDAIEFIEL